MIFFDLDDTLYDQMDPFKKAFKEVFNDEGYQAIDLIELFEHRQKYSIEAYSMYTQGKCTKQEMFIYRLMRSFKAMNYEITEKQALDFQEIYQNNQNNIELDPAMVKVLDYCVANNQPIGILSNGEDVHQWKKIKHLNLEKWFKKEAIFVSGAIGYDKPDIRIFEKVAQTVQLPGKSICLVGDNFENDIIGGNRAGWQTVFLNKYQLTFSKEDAPNYELTNSKELMTIIEKIS